MGEDKLAYKYICQILRCAIWGHTVSPPLFEVMQILGKEECMRRIRDAIR